MNPHVKWLRQAAERMHASSEYAWAHTCEQAADEIEALQAHRDRLLESHPPQMMPA